MNLAQIRHDIQIQETIVASLNANSPDEKPKVAITEDEINEKREKLKKMLNIYTRRTKLASSWAMLGPQKNSANTNSEG